MREKIFVLDTSVIVSDPRALHSFIGNKIVIPYAVYEEVDTFKKGLSAQSYAARTFFRVLNRVIESGKYLNKYVNLTENIKIKIAGGNPKLLPREFDKKKRDNQILATALSVHKESNHWWRFKKTEVILVSKDAGLRIAANALKIKTEDYKADKVKDKDIFSGNIEQIKLDLDNFKDLTMYGSIPITGYKNNIRLKANDLQCVVEDGQLVLLKENAAAGIEAKNEDQEYALWLLNNPKVQLVCLSGTAGSGKSLLSMASAVKQTIDDEVNAYKKIVIVRPIISVGKEIGFLPGTLEEKMEPWLKPIYEAIYYIMGDMDKTKVQYLFDAGIIEVAPLPYIRGRTINNAFIYIDEAQNISKNEIKTLLTRAGQKSKIVVAGDPAQIDSNYHDKYSCGLAQVIYAFQGQKLFGHCNMIKSERSELAEMSAKLL
jgi:PhoH-like ATPase